MVASVDGTSVIERTPSIWGGVENCNKVNGVKIIGCGKILCKSYPTLRVSIVRIEVRTR